ncbi:MAG: sterol desaturase family protein [Actinobacteria bacterium]|nr:sterol desaturase family protein [Actinomycetota bacterium]MBW3650475.1 sterol desaturase family protein [Actinomycetota bacterium]
MVTAPELLVVVGAFLGMEGISYLAHRFLMHGPGMGWHRSHHVPTEGAFEKNDLYPLTASSLAISAFALGTWGPQVRPLVLVGVGMTLYGLSYLFVHEVYIHRRLGSGTWKVRVLERLKEAHRVHHLFGGEPYGMLLPVVPRALRERAAASTRDPFAERARVSA